MKPIILSRHALEQIAFCGATQQEVEDTIRTAEWQPAELDRLEARKDFPFNAVWNGKP